MVSFSLFLVFFKLFIYLCLCKLSAETRACTDKLVSSSNDPTLSLLNFIRSAFINLYCSLVLASCFCCCRFSYSLCSWIIFWASKSLSTSSESSSFWVFLLSSNPSPTLDWRWCFFLFLLSCVFVAWRIALLAGDADLDRLRTLSRAGSLSSSAFRLVSFRVFIFVYWFYKFSARWSTMFSCLSDTTPD